MLLQLNICSLVEIEAVLALVRPPVTVHPPILVSQKPPQGNGDRSGHKVLSMSLPPVS